jgi:integrase
VARLREVDSLPSRCLEWLVLTAARSGEARCARWDEIDFEARTWTLAPAKMKASAEHTVPLSRQAIALLERLNNAGDTGLIFPGVRGRPLPVTALLRLAQRLGAQTVHGFRTSARSFWADHGVERELAEMNLAHYIGSAVEQAYNRTSLLERRKPTLQMWADHLDGGKESGAVVKLRGER